MQKLPAFYQDIITCFNKSKINPLPQNKHDLMQQVIWGNRHLTYWSKEYKHRVTLYFKEWIHAGITHVQDIKFINGRVDYEYIPGSRVTSPILIYPPTPYYRQFNAKTKPIEPLILGVFQQETSYFEEYKVH